MRIVTCDDVARLTNLCSATVREYLQGYRFSKYEDLCFKRKYRRLGYTLTDEFIEEFIDFLYLRRRHKAIANFKANVRKELKNEDLQS